MSFEALIWAVKSEAKGNEKLVLLCLADHHNGETGDCYPSVKRVADWCGIGTATVNRTLAKLSDLGLVTVITRTNNGIRTSNQYDLALDHSDRAPLSQRSTNQEDNPTKEKKGTRLTDEWGVTSKNLELGETLGLTTQEIYHEADKFRDYWIAKPGQAGLKLDWDRTFANWLRNAADFRRTKIQGGRPSAGSHAQGSRSEAGSITGAVDRFLSRRRVG